MGNLSDYIEEYIKKLIANSNSGKIDIQRNDLAGVFDCVPSQINYVLSTRFTIERGYIVESRRGGGGFVRIIKVTLRDEEEDLVKMLNQSLGDTITAQGAVGFIQNLYENDIITLREARMMSAITNNNILSSIHEEKDRLRMSLLKSMLIAIISR